MKTSEKKKAAEPQSQRKKNKKQRKKQCNLHRMAFTFLPNHINSSHVTLVSSIVTYYITVG